MWENALDTDENLLIKAHLLSDKTHLLQQQSHADQMVVESVAEVDAEVSKFCNQFFERGRPLQLPTEETKPS
jgi:hypothetical protein